MVEFIVLVVVVVNWRKRKGIAEPSGTWAYEVLLDTSGVRVVGAKGSRSL